MCHISRADFFGLVRPSEATVVPKIPTWAHLDFNITKFFRKKLCGPLKKSENH